MPEPDERGTRVGRDAADDGEYTRHDAAIWHTRQIVASVLAGRRESLPRVATSFAPQLGAGEVVVASGPVEVFDWKPLGDGTYQQAGGLYLGSPTAVAAFVGITALENSARRAAAASAAHPRWVRDGVGTVTVSTRGFYFQTAQGLGTWSYEQVASADLVGPAALRFQGFGRVPALVLSDWAELLLALWAVERHPHHPQLVGEGWIPPGWHERERARTSATLNV